MANITTYLNTIRTATYGEEMRSAIADALSSINSDLTGQATYGRALNYFAANTRVTDLGSSLTQAINSKVSRTAFDNIVGDGINTSDLTNYVIRLQELYNTLTAGGTITVDDLRNVQRIGNANLDSSISDCIVRLNERINQIINQMGSKEELQDIADQAVEDSAKVIMVNEDPVSNTKLHIETTSEDVELVEQSEFDSRVGSLEDFFTWNWTGDWENGGLNDSGVNADGTNMIRTKDYLQARTFELTVEDGYEARWFVYNTAKLYIERSPWFTGKSSCFIPGVAGAEYMKFVIRTEAGTTITNVNTVKSKITVKISGTSWDGTSGTIPDASVKPYLDENGIIVYP